MRGHATRSERLRAAIRHPSFRTAVLADLRLEVQRRNEGRSLGSRLAMLLELLRLMWASDGFGALLCYRAKASLQQARVPVLPYIAQRAAIVWGQLAIGDPVLVHPGVRFPHGQVVIDGFVEIRSGVEIRPFVLIGLKEGELQGPTVLEGVCIGTGAKVIGPVTIGQRAVVGANAVVVDDVPDEAVVVGVPARLVERSDDAKRHPAASERR